MLNLRTLEDLGDIRGQNVALVTNLDVPVAGEEVTNNFRIRAAIPTIKWLTEKGARVIIISHLGRPNGKYEDDMSMMPVRFELGKLLDTHIKFAHIHNCRNSVIFMEDGEVLLLENIRFHPGELSEKESERKEMVKELGELCKVYVNDAFASYRPSACTYDLALMIENRAAGLLMQKEVEKLTELNSDIQRPYVAVIGGVKLDTKIEILEDLVKKADKILLGGAMAYTFLKAQGIAVGNSKVEEDKIDLAKKILDEAKKSECEILLPIDHIGAREFTEDAVPVEIDTQQIPNDLIGLDIGERTLSNYLHIIESARTILWNGPMGVFEWKKFSRGTEAIGEYIGLSASADAFKIAGGGDTVTAMDMLKVNMKNFDHVSTGGGAMLDFLVGKEFPTLEPLKKA